MRCEKQHIEAAIAIYLTRTAPVIMECQRHYLMRSFVHEPVRPLQDPFRLVGICFVDSIMDGSRCTWGPDGADIF